MTRHVLLVQPNYYAQYPPLGLLKLSAYHKEKKDSTEFVRGCKPPSKKPDLIYVTSLFTWAWKPVWDAIRYYKGLFPDVELGLGGLYASLRYDHAVLSGADFVHRGLFSDAENFLPDYDLVPKWDGSIVFASRGCVRRCPFCAVPILEGGINSEKRSIKDFIWRGHTRVIFFDNNILASPYWRQIFDELEELGLKVDFNQGLDARLISEEAAQRISRLKLDNYVRLAYDYNGVGPYVKDAIERLSVHGTNKRKIIVYTLYNYTDDPEDFFKRVKEILNWGTVCYPMRYQPIDTLKKDEYIAPKWDAGRLEMIQRARRVIGYGGSFPPYEGLIKKFEKAKDFDEAFSLYPLKKCITNVQFPLVSSGSI